MTREQLEELVAEAGPARARIDDFEPGQEHYAGAIDWLLQLRERDLATCPEFEAWKGDPANEFAYNDIAALFARAARPAQGAAYFAGSPRSLWSRLPGWKSVSLAIAASLALVMGWPVLEGLRYLGADAASDTGEVRTVRLADGTRVTLNTFSAIDAQIGAKTRAATLRGGEAFFEVARDESRPFTIRAGDALVRVLGTKFNVRIDGDQTRVSVTRGKVRVAAANRPGAPVFLTAGEEALVTARAVQAQPAARHVTAWRQHRIAFSYTPLRVVVRELNRYRDHSIYIANGGLEDNLVSGVFATDDPEETLRILEKNLGVESVTLPTGQTFLY